MSDLLESPSGAPDRDDAEDVVLRRRVLVPSDRQRAAGDIAAAEGVVHRTAAVDAGTAGGRNGRAAAIRALISDANPRRIKGAKKPLIILALTQTIATWDDQALGILGPDIRDEFGFSVAFLVFLGTLLAQISTLTAIPFGYLADRVKRVWMVRIGSLVANVSSVLIAIAPGAGAIVGARLFGGFGNAAVPPATFPLVTDYYEPSVRTRVFAVLSAGGQLGLILGPIVVGLLGAAFGWRPAILALGVLATGVSLLTFLLREPTRGKAERVAAGMDEAEAEATVVEAPGFAEAYRTMASITTLRRFWYAAPFTVIAGAGSLTLVGFYYADVLVLGVAQRGLIQGVAAVIGLIGIVLLGPVGDRMVMDRPSRLVALAGGLTAVQALLFAGLAFAPNAIVGVIVGTLLSVMGVVMAPAFFTLISLIVPPRMRGLGLQTQAPWQFLGLVTLPLVLSSAIGGLGLRLSFLVIAAVLLPAAAIVASAAGHIERDIRNANADAVAEAEVKRLRETGAGRILLIRNVDVGYDGVQVLFDVDLDVGEGELLALLGTNGAGKSTLLRAIAGTIDPTAGAIFLDGRDITHLPAHQTAALGVVMMPGGRAVFPDLTVEQNLRTANWLYRDEDEATYRERYDQVLAFFPRLAERLDQVAGTLSGGEQQQVALGQAFIMRPRILMIDELSLGLAPQVVALLLDILRQIHAQGTTVIIVEQSLNVAVSIAERAVFMEKGQVRFDGPTDALLARPDLVRSVFIGGGGGGGRTKAKRPVADLDREVVPALELRGIDVSFGGLKALRGVDLDVRPGEIVGVIGPNGAGKTTLFDVASGFVRPDGGSVLLDGVDVTALAVDERARSGLARSFQNARLFPSLTVRENIAVFLERQTVRSPFLGAVWAPNVRRSEAKVSQRVDGFIELLGLESYAEKYVGELSTGSRRIVDVACVMAQRPKVLLLDEPTSGLAQAESEALGPLMLRIVRELGCGLVVIEHDVPLVASVSDRIVAIELGTNLVTGTPAEVTDHPEVIRAYLSATEDVMTRSGTRMDRITEALASTTAPPS